MILILTLASIILLFLFYSSINKNNVILNVAVSFATYISIFIIASSFLFWANKYSPIFLATITAIVSSLFFVISFIKNKKVSFLFSAEKTFIPIAIFLAILPFVLHKFGIFGTGQDEGIYQIKSYLFMNGFYDNYINFDFLNSMSKEFKTSFLKEINENLFNLYETNVNDTTFVMHGVYSYSAILANFGKIFGLSRMGYVNTLLVASFIVIFYNILRNLKVGIIGSTSLTFLSVISPLFIWVNKSALSENVLIVLVVTYVFFILDRKREESSSILSSLPIVAFSFIHISIYVVIPIFVLIYFMLYRTTAKKSYLVANIFILISFFVSYVMMSQIATKYTKMNYKFISSLKLNPTYVKYYILAFVTVLILISLFLLFKKSALNKIKITKNKKIIFEIAVRSCIIVLLAFLLKNSYSKILAGRISSFGNTTIFGFFVATGGIVFLVTFITLFIRPSIVLKNKNTTIIFFLYFYLVIIFATAFYPTINYYYYYGRYLIPYMFLIILMFAVFLESLKSSFVKIPIYVISLVLPFIAFFSYNEILRKYEDDTRISYSALNVLMDTFNKDDIIIIQNELINQVYYPMATKYKNVYPIVDNSLEKTINNIKKYDKKIYFINADWKANSDNTPREMIGLRLYENSLKHYNISNLKTHRIKTIKSYVSYIGKRHVTSVKKIPYPKNHDTYEYNIRVDEIGLEK